LVSRARNDPPRCPMRMRRAKENSVDFIEGVATAITPMAFLETVMVKGYATLVDEQTNVSYRDGMAAALKLAEALRQAEGEYDTVHMMAEMGRIIDAVQEFVPREKWPELQAALRGEAPIRQQQATPVQGVRMVHIDDTDEDGN
jgi:hypothetical protein